MSKKKKILFSVSMLFVSIAFCLVVLEGIARLLQPNEIIIAEDGTHSLYDQHPLLGIIPKQGLLRHKTKEFDVSYTIDQNRINRSLDAGDFPQGPAIVVLGDSHTFGWGVNTEEAWPTLLQKYYNGRDLGEKIAVYNLGVPSYGVDQYYLRLQEQGWAVKPGVVIVGFSPNDLNEADRILYGDSGLTLDNGELKEKHLAPNQNLDPALTQHSLPAKKPSARARIVSLFQQSMFLRRLVRTNFYYRCAGLFQKITGKTLWPTKEVGFAKKLSPHGENAWRVVELALSKIAMACRQKNTRLVVILIPHVIQIYDDLWNASLGSVPGTYDRNITNQRLAAITHRLNIEFIDPTQKMKETVAATGQRLHFKYDGHTNIAGQRLLANELVKYIGKGDVDR